MAKSKFVVSLRQMEHFKPSTTARRLREFLHSDEGAGDRVMIFLSYLRLAMFIYDFFPALNKQIDPLDYRDDLITIYKVRNWSPYMMASFLDVKRIFAPREWVLLWRFYQQRTQDDGLEELSDLQAQYFERLCEIGGQMFAMYGQWDPEEDNQEECNFRH